MSREVDIKALVSHIVRGDGGDKCRICMGDTSEGQVYLGDTVMMDGERPVTLAELLEVLTGVEVPEDVDLPNGLCNLCSSSAVQAAKFSALCRQADNTWNTILEYLEKVPHPKELANNIKAIYAILQDDQMTLINDYIEQKQINQEQKIHRTNKKFKHLCMCPTCGKRFNYARHLAFHLKDSDDLNRACDICGKIMLRDDLIKHLTQVHSVDTYACSRCPDMFQSLVKYKIHLRTSHAKGACVCGDCGRSFQTEFAYYPHRSLHIPKHCPACNKMFRNRTCYSHHVKLCCNLDKNREDVDQSKNKVTFEVKNNVNKRKVKVGPRGGSHSECICDYCGKKFAGKKFVCAHIQIVHLKDTHKPCPYCGQLKAAAHMTEHIKKHNTVQSFQCEHCNLKLKTKLGYVQHLRLHTGEKPYVCEFCGEGFSASSRRSYHIRQVHKPQTIKRRHGCELCPAKFRLPYQLRKHMASVHSEGSENNMKYECESCHEQVGTLRGLIQHSRKHQKKTLNEPEDNCQDKSKPY